MGLHPEQKLALIQQEYFKLQDFYEDFDKRIQSIKGWSLTIALGAITAGFSYKNAYLWLFAVSIALICWLFETIWKIFQYHYRRRIVEIENCMREDTLDRIIPLQIYTSWFDSFKSGTIKFFDVAFLTIVFLPYVPIILLGALLFLLQHAALYCFW